MRTRTVIGAGAWLFGAAAATAGSLLVVSELGQGVASPASQQSSVPADQAQASQAAGQSSSSPGRQSQAGKGGTGANAGTGGANSTSGTILTSSGGTVMAQCQAAGAFLMSWSPQQGFQASSVARGPATTARVVFTTAASTVTMAVSCMGGVPSAATTVAAVAAPAPAPPPAPAPAPAPTDDNGGGGGNQGPGGGGGDDGGGGGGGGDG